MREYLYVHVNKQHAEFFKELLHATVVPTLPYVVPMSQGTNVVTICLVLHHQTQFAAAHLRV